MNSKYKILTTDEVAHMFFEIGYQFNRTLNFMFNTSKSATIKQLDNILNRWAVQIVRVMNTAIIIAMDDMGNNIEYKKIPWAPKYVAEFLNEYCCKHYKKYNGKIRIAYKEWIETDTDYIIENYCDIE